MKKFGLFLILATLVSGIVLVSCKKDNSGTTLRVRMTDAPVAFDEVNVDIEQVIVKYREETDTTQGWINLDTHAGIYDLLGLTNGVDTLLAVGVIPTNVVKEIRFVLGADNSIVVAGVTYPLTIPSGSESGLKLKINKQLNGSLESLLIDFDAALSIHQTGTGDYQLRPVLKIK